MTHNRSTETSTTCTGFCPFQRGLPGEDGIGRVVRQQKLISHCPGDWISQIRCQRSQILAGALSLTCRSATFSLRPRREREGKHTVVSSYGDTHPFMRGPPSRPYLTLAPPKAPLQIPSHRSLRLHHVRLWRTRLSPRRF